MSAERTASAEARSSARKPARILIVDDEEAILETMTFTFMDQYEVLTSSDPKRALAILDEKAPVAVIITDQRMPEMTGVELLAKVVEKHPETVRILLTGFADMESTIQAINDGQLYAYVNKPWEPDELKQVVRRAVDHHNLDMLNRQLVEDLRRANVFLEAVMDRLDIGAIALDPSGVVRAANKPACTFLQLDGDPRGRPIGEVVKRRGLETLSETIHRLAEDCGAFEDVELKLDRSALRVRVSAQTLADRDGSQLGRVILFKEVSHEPLRRRFDELVEELAQQDGELRSRLEDAAARMSALAGEIRASGISSAGMAELAERASRTQTAIQFWLDVDDALAREDYPDAQQLLDRMRVANQRWPRGVKLPPRVSELAARVEAYYDSGENQRTRVL